MSNSTDSPDLKRTTKKPNAIDHVKTGFSATQKILTLIGTVLSVIVACITISNATSKKSDTPKSSTAVTTVIKEKEVPKPATNTDTSTPASSSHISHSTYESKDSSVSSSYSESSSQPSSSVVESSSSESIPSSSVEQSQPESTVTDSSSN